MDKLNKYAQHLVSVFSIDGARESFEGMRVNPIISEIATWYEKVRNAMEFRDEEVVLRATIERILRRKLIFGKGKAKDVAGPLLRELVWARYFSDGAITQETIEEVEESIDIFLKIQDKVVEKRVLNLHSANEWFYDVLSTRIEHILRPHREVDAIVNFAFHILAKNVVVTDETDEAADVQMYIAVRKAIAKSDIASLRYWLFVQYFGEPTRNVIPDIIDDFEAGYTIIEKQLKDPLRYKFSPYVKKLTPPFLVLYGVLWVHRKEVEELLSDKTKLREEVFKQCEAKYKDTVSKIHRGIIRSVIFILLTKTFIAFFVEGTYDRYFHGEVLWVPMAINILIPPILMVGAGIFLRAPGIKNTELIYHYIERLLYDEEPKIGRSRRFSRHGRRAFSVLHFIFTTLWLVSFLISFGVIFYVLRLLEFNIVSQGIFVFFLALVIFLAYRIRQTAKTYLVKDQDRFYTPVIDLFFMPFARVGRWITEGFSQINIFLVIIDYMIETPFKAISHFFEQWFFFLSAKREEVD